MIDEEDPPNPCAQSESTSVLTPAGGKESTDWLGEKRPDPCSDNRSVPKAQAVNGNPLKMHQKEKSGGTL